MLFLDIAGVCFVTKVAKGDAFRLTFFTCDEDT